MNPPDYPIEVGVDPAALQMVVRAANQRDGRMELTVALDPEGALGTALALLRGALMNNPALLERAHRGVDELFGQTADAALEAIAILARPMLPPENLQ